MTSPTEAARTEAANAIIIEGSHRNSDAWAIFRLSVIARRASVKGENSRRLAVDALSKITDYRLLVSPSHPGEKVLEAAARLEGAICHNRITGLRQLARSAADTLAAAAMASSFRNSGRETRLAI